jgi:CRISPR-associated endonuclease/helicase Cas3
MTEAFAHLLAKSYPNCGSGEKPPTYARLVPHLRAVERAGESIVEVAGDLILRNLDLPSTPWLSRLRRAVRVGCLCHDIGKANDGFQKMVRGQLDPRLQPVRHELLSALLLMNKEYGVRQWALDELRNGTNDDDAEALLDCVIAAVAGHHVKMDDQWKRAALALRGGCGLLVEASVNHPDLTSLFGDFHQTKSISFSLVDGDEDYFGLQYLPFSLKSNRWRSDILQNATWWRFAAALKALVMAADVAGSAMLPERGQVVIKRWVRDTLDKRVTEKLMHEVVAARLKGNPPRDFQKLIRDSTGQVTLVEAGCGSGKTAAAYLWAAHHADGKKLFFCYPTTGTATEGFLGYVHETAVEASLIHSRAIVDLEGIAQVRGEDDSEDENDHLLRIESLKAWSPQAIVCTADSVLALVRNNRRGLYNSPALLSGAFVFDELHAYDNRMFEAVVALIRALPGARFLLMTASLPRARGEFLRKNLGALTEVPSPVELEELRRYTFHPLISDEEAYQTASVSCNKRKRVLWICNTVRRAQNVVAKLATMNVEAQTYHSRFKYEDRVRRHREVIQSFDNEGNGTVAVTTQVAEMSLDLDADVLISEVAPIPALIQRLGRLNRRVSVENPGHPRPAFFVMPERAAPYDEAEISLATRWIDSLLQSAKSLSQADLARLFNELSENEELRLDTRTAWLDSGWFATPEPIRESGYSTTVILPEDEAACRQNTVEIIRRVIPMNYNRNRMSGWPEFKGNLIAPIGAISYDTRTGGVLT